MIGVARKSRTKTDFKIYEPDYMTIRSIILCLFTAFSAMMLKAQAQTTSRLWYNKPASKWTEALPVGNSRIGAMIYGDPRSELLQLNE